MGEIRNDKILCMICNKEVRTWKTTIEDEEKWVGMCIEEGCERQGQVFGLTDPQIVNIEFKVKVPWNPEDEVNIDLATMKTSIVRPKEHVDEIENLEISLEEAQNERDDQTVSLMKVLFKNAKLSIKIEGLEKQIEDIKTKHCNIVNTIKDYITTAVHHHDSGSEYELKRVLKLFEENK